MSREADLKIKTTLEKYGEVPSTESVWRVQGNAVIKHFVLERIAAKAGITWDVPSILRSERDEAVILVTGRLGDKVEWTIGEALVGANYLVKPKQPIYVWAMAEKRAKDRVILKLIELHGEAYSDSEADDFRQPVEREARTTGVTKATVTREQGQGPVGQGPRHTETAEDGIVDPDTGEVFSIRDVVDTMEKDISMCASTKAVKDYMLSDLTKQRLAAMSDEVRNEVRAFGARVFKTRQQAENGDPGAAS